MKHTQSCNQPEARHRFEYAPAARSWRGGGFPEPRCSCLIGRRHPAASSGGGTLVHLDSYIVARPVGGLVRDFVLNLAGGFGFEDEPHDQKGKREAEEHQEHDEQPGAVDHEPGARNSLAWG
eukprot:scaffold18332_cov101-Isochrysis_galbana.AAC.2